MRDVDYVKLSELYASFLIAIGGVSITVLTIVTAITPKRIQIPVAGNTNPYPPPEEIVSSFLSAALIVATVSCFIGAHMMAETAAFIKYFKEKLPKVEPSEVSPFKWDAQEINTPKWDAQEWTPSEAITFGKRLFLIASTNIFIAITLILFALVLLPAAKVATDSSLWIYFAIFVLVGIGALRWMYLASKYRMPLPKHTSKRAIIGISVGVAIWVIVLLLAAPRYLRPAMTGWLLLTFIPSVVGTGLSLIIFASIFKASDEAHSDEAHKGKFFQGKFYKAKFFRRDNFKYGYKYLSSKVTLLDTIFFGLAVTTSFVSLVAAGIEIVNLLWPPVWK